MTAAALLTIPLLRFRVGESCLGLVAAAVEHLGQKDPGCPHLGRLLGLPLAEAPAEQRTVALFAYGKMARFVVDGPVTVRGVAAQDLLPAARSLGRGRVPAVLGFARDASQTVLLLDVAWLVREAG